VPTNHILLWPGAVTLPDGSAGNAFGVAQIVRSSGAAPTGGPKLHFDELLFDPTTDEHVLFGVRMPADYVSGGTVKIQWKANATVPTNGVVWKACLAAVTPGAAEVPDSKSYPVPDTVTTLDSATANALMESSLALGATALNGAVAGDWVSLMVGRDADAAADTVTVDAAVVGISLDYTA
jgi:hypothetical protein